AGWSVNLMRRNGFGPPWTRWTILALAAAAALGVLATNRRLTTTTVIVVGLLAGLGGTAAFTVATVATPHHGSIPNAVNLVRAGVGRGRLAVTTGGGPWAAEKPTNSDVAALLAATHTPWSAATNGSQSAAALEIASGTSVMAVGGWSGDPVPTLQQFIDYVHGRKIAYYVEAGRAEQKGPDGRGPGGGEVIREPNRTAAHTREIADWVAQNYPATTVGDMVVYRLT
ncbi:MAG: family glycosyltransferase, 4-amino-4-deoxy-L-arabinose transferase, partial [Mycobacterium sp.]|nr:family glycosyltransferase, 4-amino-4-deoxy-L-arabinose transferase [Mycobacterium sp.]